MPYAAFPIYDPKTGLYLAKEPWLSPPDAFEKFLNAQIYQGKIRKRRGISHFGEIVHQVRGEAIGARGSTHYTGTLANAPIRAGDPSEHFKFTDGTQVITDNGDGTLGGDGTGTINYDTGEYDITFNAATTGDVTADYEYKPGLPVMGIDVYYGSQGSATLLAWDTKRCCQYFPLQNKFHDIVEQDLWSGDDKQYFWTECWKDKMFVTNNYDQVKVFDGTSFADLNADIDGDGNNDVDTCLMLFAYKDHLVMLHTRENGNLYPQRARWSAAGLWDDWTNDGYVDAPTLDWIVAADFLGDDLVVFFERSIWKLRYTGDPDLPFVWQKIADTEGAYATFSTITFSDEVICLGPTGLVTTDGMNADTVGADKVPDIALTFDQENYDICYAAVVEENREALISYPQAGSTQKDHILSLNYAENTWAVYDLSLNVIGYWDEESDPIVDDIDAIVDDLDICCDDKTLQAGYPTTLGGLYTGEIVELNSGGSDLGEPIALEIKTARWNPFWKEGRKARLGKVEFLVDMDPDIVLTVEFYKDFEDTPYKTVDITGFEGSGEKTWVSVFSGEVAEFHSLKIKNNQPYTFNIHAIVPYFKPAGVIK